MTIDPNYKPHSKLELEVTEFLENCGFWVTQQTYHEVLDKRLVDLLARRYDPTSLYVRGRADRTAIHRFVPVVFEWEAKTHDSTEYHNMAIEALPLAHHILKSRLGVRCLYVYHNPYRDHHAAFWVHGLPTIREIKIPIRWDDDQAEWFSSVFALGFPGVTVQRMDRESGGSGDPFAIIDESVVVTLPHWRDLVRDALNEIYL